MNDPRRISPPTSAAGRLCDEAAGELSALEARSLRRSLRPLPSGGPLIDFEGRAFVNLASNDYLGLSTHPSLKAAAADAVDRCGVGAGASRLVVGHFTLHEEVEREIAAFKHAEAALLLPTGYLANLAVLTTLAGPGDRIFLDKLSHASLIDAARASGAEVRVFPHLAYNKLDRLLARNQKGLAVRGGERSDASPPGSSLPTRAARAFIVTDSVFSMDGDVADLPRLCELADEHGAILVIDEAHGTGVLGPTGAGLAELQGVAHRVPITVSTASKALGGLGGIVTGPRPMIDLLINRARPFIYTTGVPAPQAAAIGAALRVVRDEPWRRERLLQLSERLRAGLARQGWELPPAAAPTPIIPLVTGGAEAALALAERLRDAGLFAVAIRPPTVAPGASRVRLSLRADLGDDVVDRVLRACATP